jgi:hypothetical protein
MPVLLRSHEQKPFFFIEAVLKDTKQSCMHNNYYILESACGTPETGPIYPQIQRMKPEYDNRKSDSIYSYLKQSLITPYSGKPDLDGFIMHKSAKQTDMVSNAIINGYGFFVSDKLKAIFEDHHIPPHRFYPAKVVHNGKPITGYFWMHIICDLTNQIDYVNSSFFIYKNYRTNEGYIKITSKDDYLNKKNQIKAEHPGRNITVWAGKICLSQDFDKGLELFEVGMFDANFYIGESLKNALISEKVTGCEMKITEKIIFKNVIV